MNKKNKCVVLLYFVDGSHDFLIFDNRNNCNKYFEKPENLAILDLKGLCGFKILFGILQEDRNFSNKGD